MSKPVQAHGDLTVESTPDAQLRGDVVGCHAGKALHGPEDVLAHLRHGLDLVPGQGTHHPRRNVLQKTERAWGHQNLRKGDGLAGKAHGHARGVGTGDLHPLDHFGGPADGRHGDPVRTRGDVHEHEAPGLVGQGATAVVQLHHGVDHRDTPVRGENQPLDAPGGGPLRLGGHRHDANE
jgi:hypothetical protein